MRVAVTNDLHANGGAVALMAWRYTKALQDAGHDATLITGQGDDPLPDDIPVQAWRYPKREGNSPFAMARFYQQLRAQSAQAFGRWFDAKAKKPDLWIALVVPSAIGALGGGGRRVPLLYVCNSPWGMEWLSAYRAQTGRNPGLLKRAFGMWPRRHAERDIVSRARAWTALSQTQLDWFTKEHRRTTTIPKKVIAGAVECEKHQPLSEQEREKVRRQWQVSPGQSLLVCSRRLVPRTGVDLLLQALVGFPDKVRLVVTGDGPSRDELTQASVKLGLTDRVRFTGFISRRDLDNLTASADLAVLPTRELEGFGLSAAEAMSAGTPVVATPVGALVDVVGGLDQGLVAQNVDIESLSKAIAYGLDQSRDKSFRERCSEYARTRYDWGGHKDDFVGLCEDVVGRQS